MIGRRNGSWPVVDGEPVKPYELPDDPAGNQRELLRMAREEQKRMERDRSLFRRGVRAVVKGIRARKGRGFEVTLLRRWTLECHRLATSGGEKFRVELYRRLKWDLNVEFWRSR
jgi:hypothetical protein